MGKRIFDFFKIWGNLILGVIALYEFAVPRISQSIRDKYHLESLGWAWQTWLVILLVSIIITFIIDGFLKTEKETQQPTSTNTNITGGDGVTAQTISAPVTNTKNTTNSHNTYNTYNFSTAKEEIHQIPTIAKTAIRPKRDEFAFQMGLDIQEFRTRFNSIRKDMSEETIQDYSFAREMLNKILNDDLPQADLVFREAKQIRENILDLNRKFYEFGTSVGMLISGKYQGAFDKLALQKMLLGTWSDDPSAVNGQINLIIHHLIDLLNQEGNINQQQLKIDELPKVDIKEARVRLGRFNHYMKNPRTGKIHDIGSRPKVTYFEVVFSNNPIKRTEKSTSKDVLAEITYYTPENFEIGSTTGGWMDLESLKISKTVNIPFNGDSRILLLAIRYLDEPHLYMHGIETDPDYFSRRGRDFKYRLSEKEPKDIKIKVHLIGGDLDKEYNLILYYAGKDGESKIERL